MAYAGEMAASGGYYVACGADRIVAHPSSIVGSIGVISQVILLEELLDDLGVDIETIKSGDAKDMGSPVRPLTEEERTFLQAIVDQSYQLFVDVSREPCLRAKKSWLQPTGGPGGQDALERGWWTS